MGTGSCVQGGTQKWPKEGKGDGAGGTRRRRGELEVRGGGGKREDGQRRQEWVVEDQAGRGREGGAGCAG